MGTIGKKYGDKAKLLFTDTDSLMYEVETEDFYKDISPDVPTHFDTSNYPKGHATPAGVPSGIPVGINKKVVGMFKDEAGGKTITEFVGLRSKLYSYKTDAGKRRKRCKGINKSVIEKRITFQDYKDCLFSGKTEKRKMNNIRSHGHVIYSETVNKVALSSNDDKRYICEDGVHTLAWGHCRIPSDVVPPIA